MHTARLEAHVYFGGDKIGNISLWRDKDGDLYVSQGGSIYVPKDAVNDFVQSLQKLIEAGQ